MSLAAVKGKWLLAGILIVFAAIYGAYYLPAPCWEASRARWERHAAETPPGRIARSEMRLDFDLAGCNPPGGDAPDRITLGVWEDPETVRELVSLVPWTTPGPGCGFKCGEGSPYALVFVTASGDERTVILACDDCDTSGPAWDRGVGWETPRLLTRVGELLMHEPAAEQYAAQFAEDVRRYHANWLYWAQDPYHVHDSTEADD